MSDRINSLGKIFAILVLSLVLPAEGYVIKREFVREVPGWPGRKYGIYLPEAYDGKNKLPVVMVLHGGGGNKDNTPLCKEKGSVKCFNELADREQFIVIYPNGTANPLFKKINKFLRTWNAGGGKKGFSCVSKYSCERNIDDVAYFRALLADLEKNFSIDTSKIYATGISNGGAMAYRLACELSDRIAAIAALGSGDQFGAANGCNSTKSVPIVHFHGTEDKGWPINGGESRLAADKYGKVMVSLADTLEMWITRNGCEQAPKKENMPDIAEDGTRVIKESYTGCENNADIVVYRIEGGGHTWPRGYQYLSEKRAGKISQDINANEIMWAFFKNHSFQKGKGAD